MRITFLVLLIAIVGGCSRSSRDDSTTNTSIPTKQPSIESSNRLAPARTVPDGAYKIVGVQSGKCLDTSQNGRMQIYGCGPVGKLNQEMRLLMDSADDAYSIKTRRVDNQQDSVRCIDVNDRNNNPRQILQLADCDHEIKYQKWYFISVEGKDYYQIKNEQTGQCIEVNPGPTNVCVGDTCWVVQDGCDTNRNDQLWRLKPL